MFMYPLLHRSDHLPAVKFHDVLGGATTYMPKADKCAPQSNYRNYHSGSPNSVNKERIQSVVDHWTGNVKTTAKTTGLTERQVWNVIRTTHSTPPYS